MAPYLKKNYKPTVKRRESLAEFRKEEEDDENTVDDEDGEHTYDLVSYLVHKGASAIGGHFVAHIYHEEYAPLKTLTYRQQIRYLVSI